MKKRLIIIGTSQYSEIISYYFSKFSNYEIIGYCESEEFLIKKNFLNKKVYILENLKNEFDPKEIFIFNSIGYKNHNKIRESRYIQIKNMGYKFANFISPKAIVLTDKIGDNCLILENNVIQPFVEIKNNNFLWSGNHIGHHTVVEENNFISSHVVISGNCRIGKNCFFGVNSTINDGIKIGSYSVIGSNSVISSDLEDHSVTKSSTPEKKIIKRNIL